MFSINAEIVIYNVKWHQYTTTELLVSMIRNFIFMKMFKQHQHRGKFLLFIR